MISLVDTKIYSMETELPGENIPRSVCTQLWRGLSYYSQPQWSFCATYLPRTALTTGALGIFLGLWIRMCLYLQIFGAAMYINCLASCTFHEDESVVQHKRNFFPNRTPELSNAFCTVYRILSHRLLVSCHPCFLFALGKNAQVAVIVEGYNCSIGYEKW